MSSYYLNKSFIVESSLSDIKMEDVPPVTQHKKLIRGKHIEPFHQVCVDLNL